MFPHLLQILRRIWNFLDVSEDMKPVVSNRSYMMALWATINKSLDIQMSTHDKMAEQPA